MRTTGKSIKESFLAFITLLDGQRYRLFCLGYQKTTSFKEFWHHVFISQDLSRIPRCCRSSLLKPIVLLILNAVE